MLSNLSLPLAIILFAVAAAAIAVLGTRMARIADVLADRTGLGEAMAGAILLGATTSASGAIASITAASGGDVDLAYANSLGGIAAQTAFLGIADIAFRKANLEHAAASVENITQAVMLVLMLSVPLLATMLPQVTVAGVHPASIFLIVLYVVGVRLARLDRESPMWRPRETTETRLDVPDEESDRGPSTAALFAGFALTVVVVGVAGWVVARTGLVIAARTGISESVVGALMTATATSLPELVTTLAAVRRGALQMAVGGIIGGNTFDVLFLSASDIAYRDGSLYGAIDTSALFWAVVGVLMTAVLILGLIRREQHGPGNIGVESVSILAIYCGAVLAAAFAF